MLKLAYFIRLITRLTKPIENVLLGLIYISWYLSRFLSIFSLYLFDSILYYSLFYVSSWNREILHIISRYIFILLCLYSWPSILFLCIFLSHFLTGRHTPSLSLAFSLSSCLSLSLTFGMSPPSIPLSVLVSVFCFPLPLLIAARRNLSACKSWSPRRAFASAWANCAICELLRSGVSASMRKQYQY